jgi:GAF domain-containing protein
MESTATPSNPAPAPVRPIPGFREQQRIKILRHYQVLDTPPEEEFDDLAALAAQVCGTPIAMISLVDEDRQWFKAKYGMTESETPREQSFCAHALHQSEMLIVPDATLDERFVNNPLVTGKPGIRFYAGAPLISPKDATLGTLCVIDRASSPPRRNG